MNKFFLVGCPRSGTTMVQQALNRHSQIVIPPETKYFFSFYDRSWQQQIRHLARLNTDLGIQLPPPPIAVRTAAAGRAFYDLMAAQYTRRLAKPDVVYFGEKTPEHTSYLPRIREMFPEAKVLVVYRDGRDVALSLSRMPWMPANLYVGFIVWLYYQRCVRNMAEALGNQLYLARYEDIVADPQREFANILRFLDLPYESAVADGYGNTDGIPQREYAWKARALEKITPQRVGRFRHALTDEQVGILERLGHDTLQRLGYPLLTNGRQPLPFLFRSRLLFNLSRFVVGLPWHAVVRELLMPLRRCCDRDPPWRSPGSITGVAPDTVS